jgi:hypothetical protein
MPRDNADVARSMVTLADYEQMIETYKNRVLSGPGQVWFETVVRQRDLKRKGA